MISGLDNGSCGYSLALSYGGSAFVDGTPVPFSTQKDSDGSPTHLVVDLMHDSSNSGDYEFTLTMFETAPDSTRSKSLTFNVKLEYLCDITDLILPLQNTNDFEDYIYHQYIPPVSPKDYTFSGQSYKENCEYDSSLTAVGNPNAVWNFEATTETLTISSFGVT